MSDYDFKPLNDKEFEILCADLLGNAEGHRFERFKAGKEVVQLVTEHVIELFSSDMTHFINTDSAFSSVEYGDERTATREIEKLIEDELMDVGINYSSYDVTRILDSFDVADGLQSYFENNYRDADRDYSEGPAKLAIDEIDDLFDRT